MAIKDTLRKAAQLFVEMPEEPEEDAKTAPPNTFAEPSPATTPAADTGMDDIDKRLAQMTQTLQGMGSSEPKPVTTSAATTTAKTVEQVVREAEGPNLDEITATPAADEEANILKEDGTIDFPALYAHASLPAAPFSAEQARDMLASLPANLPLEVKRQTVQVMVGSLGKAIGATPETIVADASRKLAALSSYSDHTARQAADFVAAADFEIQELLKQVEAKRQGILAAKDRQSQIQSLCAAEVDRLDDVLEFFSLDVPPSRNAAPAGTNPGTSSV
ncbi:MAG: hypothetical protein V4671_19800 [Armatimonadota bacterium]